MGNRNNKQCIIALPTPTYAMRSAELLKAYGISAQVVKLDPSVTRKGCGNGITLSCNALLRARDILLDHSIPVSETAGG